MRFLMHGRIDGRYDGRIGSRIPLIPAALPYISMATSAMAPNHGAVAPHESVAGAWPWVCSRCGWFPWLGC